MHFGCSRLMHVNIFRRGPGRLIDEVPDVEVPDTKISKEDTTKS